VAFKMKSSVEEKLAPQMYSPMRRITDPSTSRQIRPSVDDSSLSQFDSFNFDDLYGVTPDGFYDTTGMGYNYTVAAYGDDSEKELKKGKYAYTERVLVLSEQGRYDLKKDIEYFENADDIDDFNYARVMETHSPVSTNDMFDVIQTTKIENKDGDLEQVIVKSKDKTTIYNYDPESGKLLNIDEQDADNEFELGPSRGEIENVKNQVGIGTS